MSANSSIVLADLHIGTPNGRCPTGIPLDELRYRHWKSINHLLLQAEAFESRPSRLTDPLGEKSMANPASRKICEDGSIRTDHLPWLLEHLEDIEKEVTKYCTEEEWHTKILNLRGPDYQLL